MRQCIPKVLGFLKKNVTSFMLTPGSLSSHKTIVLPTRALRKGEEEYAVAFAIPTDTAMKHRSFERLFEPIKLGDLSVKNRVVMTAMSTGFAGPKGQVTDRMIEYYAKRAEGGVGLVTVEEAAIHPQLYHIRTALGIFGDHLIPGLKALANRIHEEGAAASIQIGLYFRQEVIGFPRYAAYAKRIEDIYATIK